MMNRRDFIAQFAAAATLSAFGVRASAQTATTGQLVFVFLRGGADALSILPPLGAAATSLKAFRPTISVANPVAYTSNLGLHPVFGPWLADATLKANMNFILHAGSTHDTRSHFEQMARIETANMSSISNDGFLARAAAALANRATFAVSTGQPASLKGANPLVLQDPAKLQPGYSEYNLKPRWTRAQRLGMFKTASGETGDAKVHALASLAQSKFDAIDDVSVTKDQLIAANGYVPGLFGGRMALAGHLLSSALNPAFIAVDGDHIWDTHVGQATNDVTNPQGIATKLDNVSKNLLAFKKDLTARGKWSTTTVVVMTEFGRTIKENGDGGTDHGRGGLMILMGGKVRPITHTSYLGPKAWTLPTTVDASSALTVVHDYRAVLAEVMQKACGMTQAQVLSVFLNQISASQYLGVV